MDTSKILDGKFMLLPDGQKARVVDVEDGYALLRRVEGSRAGDVAVCHVSKLEPVDSRASATNDLRP